MNNGTDHKDRKPTPQQLREIMGLTQGKVAEIIVTHYASATFDEMQALLLGGGVDLRESITRQLAPIFTTPDDPYRAQRALWEKYFREHYGITADLSQVRIPAKPTEGKWRLSMIAQGLTMNHAAACYKKIMRAHNPEWNLWLYQSDLDATVTDNIRTSAESYAIWVRDEAEPDKQYLGKSTEDADPDKTIGVTLLERLVHGVIHFLETKKHLDEKGVTLCTGSRCSGGSVPDVRWCPDDRGVYVYWFSVGCTYPRGGLRSAVS